MPDKPDHTVSRDHIERIEERLRSLELHQQKSSAHLETEVSNLVRLMSEIRDIIKRHDTMFFGSNGQVGLLTRIDRLEQADKSRQWLVRAGMATTVGLVVKVLWDIIVHSH